MLQEEIKNKVKEAMLAKDSIKLDTYRGILASLTNKLVATGKKPSEVLNDEEVIGVITSIAKQRKDSIEQFKKGNRDDLVKEEEAQLQILETYLPKLMNRAEIEKIAQNKKIELAIEDASKKGILMQALMKELKGKADGSLVKEVVDSLF